MTSPFAATGSAHSARGLDRSYTKHNCANYGAQAHLRRYNKDGSIDVIALPCWRWTCTACANNILTPRMGNEIVRILSSHGLDQWVSLTLRHDTAPDPAHYAKELLAAWRKLTRQYKRDHGAALPYLWVKEIENDWPHLHVFTHGVRKKWLKKWWHRFTGAQQVRLTPITRTPEKLASYAIKNIPGNARAYGTSCNHWWGTSAGIHLKLRPKSEAPKGEWEHHVGPIDLRDYPKDRCEIIRTDRVARPTALRVKPRNKGLATQHSAMSPQGSPCADSPHTRRAATNVVSRPSEARRTAHAVEAVGGGAHATAENVHAYGS